MYSRCPVCSGQSLKDLWQVNGYTVAECGECALVFVRNRVTREELAVHYSSSGDDSYRDANLECLNHYYRKLRDLIERRVPKRGRLLDVGCSAGWFLDVMQGWECYGNEIVSSDAELARKKYGDRIVPGPFEELPSMESYFDAITLQDVFDHFPDPVPALRKCHRLLKPGGLIAIKVHNISCLYAKLTGPSFYAVIPPSHLFYYNRQTLARLLANTGFQMVDWRFIGHLLKVRTAFSRLGKGNPNSWAHRLARALDGNPLGEVTFRKNLHDIITVLAVKPPLPSRYQESPVPEGAVDYVGAR